MAAGEAGGKRRTGAICLGYEDKEEETWKERGGGGGQVEGQRRQGSSRGGAPRISRERGKAEHGWGEE